jgi:hypothetical protein
MSPVADRKWIFLKVAGKLACKLSTERAGIAPALAVSVAREGNYLLPDYLKLSQRHLRDSLGEVFLSWTRFQA